MFLRLFNLIVLLITFGTVSVIDTYNIYSIDNTIPGYDLTYRDVFGDSLYGEGKTNLIDINNASSIYGTKYLNNDILEITCDGTHDVCYGVFYIGNHYNNKMYFSYDIKGNLDTISLNYALQVSGTPYSWLYPFSIITTNLDNWNNNSVVYTISNDYNYRIMIDAKYTDSSIALNKTHYIKNLLVYDLTSIFGSGNEPTLEEFEVMLEYYETYVNHYDFDYTLKTLTITDLFLFTGHLIVWYVIIDLIKKGFKKV
jgi:hypothetical protein